MRDYQEKREPWPWTKGLPVDWRVATLQEARQLKATGHLAVIVDDLVLVPVIPTRTQSTSVTLLA
jgi:hypothetical protein